MEGFERSGARSEELFMKTPSGCCVWWWMGEGSAGDQRPRRKLRQGSGGEEVLGLGQSNREGLSD